MRFFHVTVSVSHAISSLFGKNEWKTALLLFTIIIVVVVVVVIVGILLLLSLNKHKADTTKKKRGKGKKKRPYFKVVMMFSFRMEIGYRYALNLTHILAG